MQSAIYFIHCISPLHVGTGDDGLVIDAPIARLRSTNMPYIPDSAVKGAWRAASTHHKERFKEHHDIQRAFGPDRMSGNLHAGAVKFGSASILCLPVRSYHGTFCWVSCPLLLRQFSRDCENFGSPLSRLPDIPVVPDEDCAVITGQNDGEGAFSSALINDTQPATVAFEELDFNAVVDVNATSWARELGNTLYPDESDGAWQDFFIRRFAVVDDDVFVYLAEYCTEIRTRIAIDNSTGAVAESALWTEELIPSETIFWGGIAAEINAYTAQDEKIVKQHKTGLTPFAGKERLQLGANASIGQGQTLWRLPPFTLN